MSIHHGETALSSIVRTFLNAPVRKKQMITHMLIALISVLILGALFLIYDSHTTRDSVLKETTLVADIIGKRTAPALAFIELTGNEPIKEHLADLSAKPSIVLACVYKSGENGVLATYNGIANSGVICPNQSDYGVLQQNEKFLSVYKPIVNAAGKEVGSILVLSDKSEIEARLTAVIGGVLIVTCAVLILAYFISQQLQKVITVPLTRLDRVAEKVTMEKDYNLKAEKMYEDEIGLLSDSFNAMLAEIGRRDQQLEQKVKERTAELETALKVKNDFLSNMSHEIRTPIHAVKNYASFLKDEWEDCDEEEKIEFVEKLNISCERLDVLINNLLDLAKLEEGKMEYTIRQNNIVSIAQRIIDEMQGMFESKSLQVNFKQAGQNIQAACDEGRISQVIQNLLGNAVKYSDGAGVVTIDIQDSKQFDDSIEFAISDQGVGLPEGELQSIFDKFAESSFTKSQAGGTGIGLALCKEIVTAHDGAIFARNNPDKGSTFIFTLSKTVPEESKQAA